MNKDEALKLALEALEIQAYNSGDEKYTQAITAIKQAFAAPTQDIPDLIAGALGVSRGTAYDMMREALKEASPVQEPEIVQRVKRYVGKTMRSARNPNITARECIELANWIADHTPPAAQRQRVVFPTMLRKMWSGGEVQAWLDENVNKDQHHE